MLATVLKRLFPCFSHFGSENFPSVFLGQKPHRLRNQHNDLVAATSHDSFGRNSSCIFCMVGMHFTPRISCPRAYITGLIVSVCMHVSSRWPCTMASYVQDDTENTGTSDWDSFLAQTRMGHLEIRLEKAGIMSVEDLLQVDGLLKAYPFVCAHRHREKCRNEHPV